MRRHFGLMLMGAALAALPCAAQNKPDPGPAPCKVEPDPVPCGAPSTPTPAGKPSAAQKFPFPGETGNTAAPAPNAASPNLSGVPDAPGAAPAAGPKEKFPFPGETGSSAATPDAGSSSSSSSSSSGDAPTIDADGNPVTPALADKATPAASATPGRHILHRVNPIGTKLETADERESEDLDVAHFYLDSGDIKGAYTRSQDAVKTAPDDPDAHFLLAQVAQKLNKREEAIAEYNACLKLDPTDKQAKDARKALARLKP
jgi:tetratricopeptide (TPR) repeat protein